VEPAAAAVASGHVSTDGGIGGHNQRLERAWLMTANKREPVA